MKKIVAIICFLNVLTVATGQLTWKNVDSLYAPLPASVHVFYSNDLIDGKPNVAYYVEADLNDKDLVFAADTSRDRRLTPAEFYKKEKALLVVNSTFFSFATNRSLNTVVKDGKLVAFNQHTIAGRGKDTLTYRHPFASAIGISKKRKADIAWLYTDSSSKYPLATQVKQQLGKDSVSSYHLSKQLRPSFQKWKMETAVGGGPVLIQDGAIAITNNEEWKFAGKAINDKHPRTAMGYTTGNKLIILVVEGRNPGKAEGATLQQLAQMFKDLNCAEALNLDGGGSSCMLVNGKDTIKVSDRQQRAVPAVFIIKYKN